MTRQSTSPRRASWGAFLSAAGLGLCLAALVYPLVYWNFHCTSFNGSDEAGYLTALDFAYSKIQSEGLSIVPALHCGIPGSHYMLWPELGLPAMLLSAGNVLVSYRVTLFLFYLLVLLYTFLNVNLACRDRTLAVFATCIIGSAPWLVKNAHVFLNEIAWIAAVSAAVYHACCSDGWQKKFHCIAGGIAVGLAICVRPMETFVTCSPLVCLVVLRSYRHGIFDRASYALGVAATAIILLVVRLNDRHNSIQRVSYYLAVVGGLCAVAIIDCAVVRKIRGFKLWIMFALIPALFFWIPRIKGFYDNVHACTFGSMMKVNPGPIVNAHLLDFLKDFLLVVGHENIVFAAILWLAVLAARILSRKRFHVGQVANLSETPQIGNQPPVDARFCLGMALASSIGVALTTGLELASGGFDERRIYLGAYLVLVFGLGWILAQFNAPPQGQRVLLRAARVMAGGYALISIAVMINCYVFAGSKPYGMALETNPDTRYQDGVVHAVNSTVESGAVVIPLGVTMYLDKDYAALLARLEKSQQTWVVDNRLVNAVDADDAFRCLSTYRQGEYLTTDMDSAPNPPTHKVYHALIRRIVDSYLQAVAANRKVPGTTFSVAGRKYLLTRIQDAVALAHAPSITP